MRYNSLTKKVADVTLVFITRGKAKPFTDKEVTEYLKQRMDDLRSFPIDVDAAVEEIEKPFKIRDELRNMFLKDMRQFGVQHCVNKYGGTSKQITDEATRVAPYLNRDFKK